MYEYIIKANSGNEVKTKIPKDKRLYRQTIKHIHKGKTYEVNSFTYNDNLYFEMSRN